MVYTTEYTSFSFVFSYGFMVILVQMALCLRSVQVTAVGISVCCLWHYHGGTNHGYMKHTDLDLFGAQVPIFFSLLLPISYLTDSWSHV
jgi:hypothetical protein